MPLWPFGRNSRDRDTPPAPSSSLSPASRAPPPQPSPAHAAGPVSGRETVEGAMVPSRPLSAAVSPRVRLPSTRDRPPSAPSAQADPVAQALGALGALGALVGQSAAARLAETLPRMLESFLTSKFKVMALPENKWLVPFPEHNDEPEVRLLVKCKNHVVHVMTIHANEEHAPPHRHDAVIEYITRVNYSLRYGSFDFDSNDGEVRFRSSFELHPDSDWQQSFDSYMNGIIELSIVTYRRYYRGLRAVIDGAEPAQQYARADNSSGARGSSARARSDTFSRDDPLACHFGYKCNGCDTVNMKGYRYNCKTCDNYDLCEDCFKNKFCTASHRADHEMHKIPPAFHRGVNCDGCRKEDFHGDRFKCTICHNYDLCASCQANKVTTLSHMSSHVMSHLRRPLMEPTFELVRASDSSSDPADLNERMQELLRLLAAAVGGAAVGGNGPSSAAATIQVAPPDETLDRAHISVDFRDPSMRLGKGGSAEVWLGKYAGSPVAIKVLPIGNVDEKSEAAFIKEIRLQCTLTHPRVVQMIGVCRSPDEGWLLVQELCKNKSLHDVIRNPALRAQIQSFALRKTMAIEAAQGLAILHVRKVMHLDIKPLNFLVTEHMQVKIADFGLSRAVRNTSAICNDVRGYTLAYASPEVLNGEFGFPADIFSFAIVLYELFTLKEPYTQYLGVPGGAMRLPLDVVNKNVRPDLPADLDSRIRSLLTRMWDKDPAKRPTIHHVLTELEAL